MPNYITLFKLTDQGIKAIKDAPGRIAELLALIFDIITAEC